MKKRVLAMLLAVCMVVGMMPAVNAAAAAGEMPFTDVKSSDWFYDEVQYVYEKGMMNGVSDNKFAPNAATNRAMLVTILYRLEGEPAADGTGFDDVAKGQWYYNAVLWASANGIVSGYGNGKFGPTDSITREQMAVILYRYAMHKGYESDTKGDIKSFDDYNKVSSYAVDALNWAVGSGLIGGVGNNKLDPKGTATRAQVATILMRFCEGVAFDGHTVTFDYNYDDQGTYLSVVVGDGDTVDAPEDPMRIGYTFTGWYTEASAENKYNFALPVNKDIVLYAGWESNSDNNLKYEVSGGGTQYSITGIEVVNGKANVTVNADAPCTMKLSILDENTEEVIQTITTKITQYCEMETISVSINTSLPEHYIIAATLYDTYGKELCNTYRCIKYTSAYEEFSKLTVDDFVGERIVNFDNSKNTNFGVLDDDVVVINQSANVNVLKTVYPENYFSEDAKIQYYFSKANGEVTSLKSGDIIMAEDTDGQVQLFKIERIISAGSGEYLLTASEDVELVEFYSFIKADMTMYPDGDQTLDTPQMSNLSTAKGVEYASVSPCASTTVSADFSGEVEVSPEEWLNIIFSFKMDVEFDIEIIYDVKLFKDDYLYFSLINKTEIEYGIEVEAKKDNGGKVKDQLNLVKVTIPTQIPGLTVYFAETLPFEWKITGSFNLTQKNKSTTGFVYDSVTGYEPIEKKEQSTSFWIEAQGEIKFGPKSEIGIEFLKVAKCAVSVHAGVKGTIKLETDKIEDTNAESIHACGLCLSGKCEWFVDAGVKLEIKFSEKVKWTPVDGSVGTDGPIKLFGDYADFYVSLSNGDDSVFGGEVSMGGGSCPNKKWRVEIEAVPVDKSETDIGIKVTDKDDEKLLGEGESPYVIYLYNGIYFAAAEFDSGTCMVQVNVDDDAVKYEIPEQPGDEDKPGDGENPGGDDEQPGDNEDPGDDEQPGEGEANGQCGDNVYWKFDEETGTLTIYGEGDMWGFYSNGVVSSPWYSFRDSINFVDIIDGVTSIGYYAFSGCTNLSEVAIPDGVTYINASAFEDCASLTDVIIPDGVTAIYSSVFEGCSNLTNIIVPNSVTRISSYAFSDCTSLTSIEIPSNVTYIGQSAFYECISLTSVNIPDGITEICSRTFEGCRSLESVIIPNSVTSVGYYAFNGCSGLSSLIISDGVNKLDDGVFGDCSSLTSISIPNSVTSIGDDAFEGCYGLTYIKIPDSVVSMGDSVFYRCSGLSKIDLSEGLTSIGRLMFFECSSLETVSIPSNVTSIGSSAFSSCSSLESINIPYGVTSIGDLAFFGCSSLKEIVVAAGNNFYASDEYGVLFTKTKTKLIHYPAGNDRTHYSIPSSVTSIEDRAFYGSKNLLSVVISDGVTTIGESAFLDCSGLSSVVIPNSVTSIGRTAFYGCSSMTNVTISKGVTSIVEYTFWACPNLTSVFFGGNAPYVEEPFIGSSAILYYIPGTTGWTDSQYYDAEDGTWHGYKLATWAG